MSTWEAVTPTPDDDRDHIDQAELVAYDEAYNVYANLRHLYEQLIEAEYDPQRREVLLGLLEDLNEENK